MDKDKDTVEQFEFKAQMKQLLHIIAHSLYTHPEVFMRELISNASDALNKVRFLKLTSENILEPDAPLSIRIEADSNSGHFSIEDTGIGMSREELIDNIGTVARSGTIEFLQKLQAQKKESGLDFIGQFGVGFYSVFMVTDEVTIETRQASPGSGAFRWKSSGQGSFTVEPIEKSTRGTKIYFTLKEDSREFSKEFTVKETIRKYSNFVDFPILVNGDKVNTTTALWHKRTEDLSKSQVNEFYKFLTNDFNEPLVFRHFSLEGDVNFKALLFIPSQAPIDFLRHEHEKSLQLYSNKILIQQDAKALLPEYLRFVKGVLDTEDLPLNISRELAQASPVTAKIRAVLVREILAWLKQLTETGSDTYAVFYKNFSPLLKLGVSSDFTNREAVVELLRFESSLTPPQELTSLKDYCSRMKQDQKAIYYLSGERQRDLRKAPHLEYFRKNGIEVLLLTEPVDVFTVPAIGEYQKISLQSIEKAGLELVPEDRIEKPQDALSKSLLSLFKEILKDKVEDVVPSKRLVDSAVALVSQKDAMDAQLEKMVKFMDTSYSARKKILEVNLTHPLITNLSRLYMADAASTMLAKYIEHLYEGALLIEGNLATPSDFIKRMTEIMQDATK